MDESNEVTYEAKQNYGHCSACDLDFVFKPDEQWFDEHGLGYSTKLCRCPYCGKIVILKYIEDHNLDVNSDERFYK